MNPVDTSKVGAGRFVDRELTRGFRSEAGVNGAQNLDLPPRRVLPVGIYRTKYGGRCAILHGATLQPGHLLHAPSLFSLSLALVPRLIGMNIHYSMIFLEHPHTPTAQGDSVHGGSLIRNNDRQTLRSKYETYLAHISRSRRNRSEIKENSNRYQLCSQCVNKTTDDATSKTKIK